MTGVVAAIDVAVIGAVVLSVAISVIAAKAAP